MNDKKGEGASGASRSSLRLHRNSRSSFLLGASWSHHHEWPQRTTHFYLGPWLLTLTTPSRDGGA